MRTLVILPAARQDLKDIWTYIAADNVAAADRVADEIELAMRKVQSTPGTAGHRRRDVSDPAFRFVNVYSYVIGYEYDDRQVTIVRIVHGRRDFTGIFPIV